MSESCSVGKASVDEVVCYGDPVLRSTLSEEQINLLNIRTGSKKKMKAVCVAHAKKYLYNYESHHTHCCDPFEGHPEVLRRESCVITLFLRNKGKMLNPPYMLIPGQKLCAQCKITLYKKFKASNIDVPVEMESSPSKSTTTSQSASIEEIVTQPQQNTNPSPDYEKPPSQSCLTNLNNWLSENGEDNIDFSKLQSHNKTYLVQQLNKVYNILKKCASIIDLDDTNTVSDWQQKSLLYDELIQQLKSYFVSSNNKSDKVLSLSVLPQSLSVEAIKSDFPASNRLIRKVKSLTKEKGILCTPDNKSGRPLDEETTKKVIDFYIRQDVSKEQAGKNQVISVKGSDGKRVRKRKRLVLGNLKHLHAVFQKEFTEHPISFSKFALLRPKECVLASASGMHNVCVCTHHENPKLMFEGAHLKSITLYKQETDCLKTLMCSPATNECNLRTCKSCPDNNILRDKLLHAFDEEMIENVMFNQWESTDRTNIVTLTLSVEDFVERFVNQLEDLIPHHFIYKAQAQYFRKQQASLTEGEIMVVGDFAENYTFKVQNMTPAFYFGGTQATIHPFSCYFKKDEEIKQYSCAVISDCLDHGTAAVHTFQKTLIEHIKEKNVLGHELEKVIYYSDGCGGQYKNRKMAANICYHEKDFGVPAEWNFFATSHGKSACDGIGGRIKRLATLYSLQHTQPGTQITSARRLYDWCQTNVTGIKTLWVTKEEVAKDMEFLTVRFESALAIEGIQSCHSIAPIGENTVFLKRYSEAYTGEEKKISSAEEGVSWENIRGFVTFWDKKEPKWMLGTVQDKCENSASISIQKLVLKNLKKYDYEYTDESPVSVSADCILTLPKTSVILKGTVVKILASESKSADAVLKKKIAAMNASCL
ncbi:hypothetical protein FOCC_FOCC005036 [Frankliniella occidentalis]|nr:hypothetical protein FOCC_FOCC005036 [Frankliniella occidentalis]